MRIEAILASPSTRCNPVESRSNGAPKADQALRVRCQACSYHLGAIQSRISCATIRRRFILFDAAKILPFVSSPLSHKCSANYSPLANSQSNLPRFSCAPPADAKFPPPASRTLRRPQKHPPAPFRRSRFLDQAHACKNESGGKAWPARHGAIPWRIHVL